MTVALKEIPVWEAHERVRSSFLTGLPSYTSPQADANVRYPPLKSTTPLYGRIGPENLPDAQREGGGNRGGLAFMLDQFTGRSGNYDLLYFDENADGDRETFIIEVTYDTRELYGTVIGKREITIARP
jgi:hypothetical protein